MYRQSNKPLPASVSHEVLEAPAWEMLSVDDLRIHLRLPDFPGASADMTENNYLTSLIKAVGGVMETHTRRPLRFQVRAYTINRNSGENSRLWYLSGLGGCSRSIVLNTGPIQRIRAISFRRQDETYTIPESDYRVVGLGNNIRRSTDIWFEENASFWTWDNWNDDPDIRVEVDCGYATQADLPAELIHAARLIASNWYSHRNSTSPMTQNNVPMSVKYLLNQFTRKVF